jgi:(2R)-sulfolactate sulfo-lyase subunit alpha
MKDFLVHDARDNVAVVIRDVKLGETLAGEVDGKTVRVVARSDVPLGHKIALANLKVGETVVKYGEDIGKVVAEIHSGDHVHTHNLKTKRW